MFDFIEKTLNPITRGLMEKIDAALALNDPAARANALVAAKNEADARLDAAEAQQDKRMGLSACGYALAPALIGLAFVFPPMLASGAVFLGLLSVFGATVALGEYANNAERAAKDRDIIGRKVGGEVLSACAEMLPNPPAAWKALKETFTKAADNRNYEKLRERIGVFGPAKGFSMN